MLIIFAAAALPYHADMDDARSFAREPAPARPGVLAVYVVRRHVFASGLR